MRVKKEVYDFQVFDYLKEGKSVYMVDFVYQNIIDLSENIVGYVAKKMADYHENPGAYMFYILVDKEEREA